MRPFPNLWSWPRRHPWLAVLALVPVLVGTGVAGAFLWAQYHLRAAEAALERSDLDEAQHHLDRCLQVRFRSAAVHLLAARTARRREDYPRAEQHLAACLDLEGMTEATALERLLLTAQQGDLNDVEGLLRPRTGANDPQAVLVLEALALAYVGRCLQVDALVSLNLLLQRQPDQPQALLMRARVWENLASNGRTEREPNALADYEKALALKPSFAARLGLAGTLYRLGRPFDALLEYQRLHQAQADHPEVLLGLARCRYSLNEVDEARRLLDELLAQHPDHAAALLERGRLALHAGQLARAEKWLRQAAAGAPRCEHEALLVLCRCLEAAHKDEEARRCRRRLRAREANVVRVDCLTMQVNRDPRNVAFRYEVARELLRLGREQAGVGGLFLVLEQEPHHGPAHAALADYFERKGQPDRAARHRRASAGPANTNPRAW
jgi:tetratricopeptide (TPR) repeat protein